MHIGCLWHRVFAGDMLEMCLLPHIMQVMVHTLCPQTLANM